jgi:putative heme-binding domain-containing protein
MKFLPTLLAALLLAGAHEVIAISPDAAPTSDPSPEAELASFVVHPDFEVTLFADETLGIANPVAIQWDHRGRLWVLCTLAYAQLKPGERPDDKLYILEDTDGDGKADKTTLFADGLNMPMGFALGHGGAWVAEDTDLVFLKDTDGDDRSDEKSVVLTGFGTGDTHQNISNLVFDAGGFLYFSQGLHAFSQVETPWGVSRGDTAGFWRFDPRLQRLDPFGFPSMMSQNPCGIALDQWGALFVKSNGPHLGFATPGLIPTTHPRELMQFAQVGQTPGKSMGGDIVRSAHLPDWIQNHAIIAGYFAREVSAIPLVDEGAGFAASPPVQLIYGGHESFRPVDIRQGPDGAIYIADWFNPIINHYQVSLRHPDRDYTHGRIWKLSARGRDLIQRPDLAKATPDELIEQLRSPERWPREQARRLLSDHADSATVIAALRTRLAEWKDDSGVALVEAAGVLESLGAVDAALLDRLQVSTEPFVRAAAARIIARSTEPISDADARLAKLLVDPHPRPRLEAVVACANRPGAESLKLALSALDAGPDQFVEYSLSQAVFALEEDWRQPLQDGKLIFAKPAHLAFFLETYGGEISAGLARRALEGDLAPADRARLLVVLARLGGPEDLGGIFAEAVKSGDPALLEALTDATRTRGVVPKPLEEKVLADLISAKNEATAAAGIRLAGLWGARSLTGAIKDLVLNIEAPTSRRVEATVALARLSGEESVPFLRTLLVDPFREEPIQRAALQAIALVDVKIAADILGPLITMKLRDLPSLVPVSPEKEAKTGKQNHHYFALLPTLLAANGGPAALAAVFESGTAPDSATAQEILNAMNRLGRTDAKLTPLLNQAIGRQSGAPEYDPDRVAAAVSAIREGKGDAKRGAEVYRMAQLACVACHQIGDEGGVIGPALNGVGAGMPLDQIVESILWPNRQIKEGFQAVAFTTTAGVSITGYVERESDDIVWYRDTGTPWIKPLAKKDIASREVIPTLMPPHLTASLTDEQFFDLVAYLASLKG